MDRILLRYIRREDEKFILSDSRRKSYRPHFGKLSAGQKGKASEKSEAFFIPYFFESKREEQEVYPE
ncbi:hypothetical protein [Gillisia limnaea]|uniref:hypothetical protein n=1 Tax=Gillisia limnaea TaxID=195907 RepID=UPI000A068605|nr:hypothetical protein [Gillisia limnaea]